VPVALSGTERMMRKGSSLITPGVATIRMLPRIDPENYASREELMVAVREAIAEALPNAMKPLNGNQVPKPT
jgi:1-acyl-sn-glycerol-3-phosphate acyltransferase